MAKALKPFTRKIVVYVRTDEYDIDGKLEELLRDYPEVIGVQTVGLTMEEFALVEVLENVIANENKAAIIDAVRNVGKKND